MTPGIGMLVILMIYARNRFDNGYYYTFYPKEGFEIMSQNYRIYKWWLWILRYTKTWIDCVEIIIYIKIINNFEEFFINNVFIYETVILLIYLLLDDNHKLNDLKFTLRRVWIQKRVYK